MTGEGEVSLDDPNESLKNILSQGSHRKRVLIEEGGTNWLNAPVP